ncbi:MAG: sensor domain-containing diguanylate cyclase [Candidatus Izemoplasmatales bacterium]|nr:sensor domain-containing diguanylate cyclase [Candidatus Izemoplasmatales bacterium]
MKHPGQSNEELQKIIADLKIENEELLKEKALEDELAFSWAGNLGRWYWDVKTDKVRFNPLKVTAIGYDMSELPEDIGFRFFTEKLHPDDYEPTMQAMRDHLEGRSDVYEVEYRIKSKSGAYRYYYDRGVITRRDNAGKPLFLAGIVFDVTKRREIELELEEKNKILAKMAITDSLTSLNNHRSIYDNLNKLLSSKKDTESLSVAIFDLDDFKKINDTRGHLYGDTVLREVASVIKESLREGDIAGRYGGEEFLIIFPDTSIDEAHRIADKIRSEVQLKFNGESIGLTISGGVAEANGESANQLIDNADRNLYRSKHSGKNKITSQ